ncbi:HD domain-containing protein [bacterium]|nr:HD domain-containing protein [bacterium]
MNGINKYITMLDFLKEIETFKTCERTCHTTKIGRAESDAEHSWHLALFLMLFEKEFESVDFTKLLKMALIHDLPELYAGDTNPYRGETKNKEENEEIAARELFSRLPDFIGENLISLFAEYQKQESAESRLVKSADKLMPLVQNLCTNEHHSSYRKLKVKTEEVEHYMGQYFTDDSFLKKLYSILLKECKEKGVFYSEDSSQIIV